MKMDLTEEVDIVHTVECLCKEDGSAIRLLQERIAALEVRIQELENKLRD